MKTRLFLPLVIVFAASLLADEPKPVAVWSFEEASGDIAKDVTGNGNDGVIKNTDASKCRVQGIVGKAIDLNGGYIEIPDAKRLNLPGPITVCAWIKPTEGRTHMAIFCKKGDVQPLGYRFSFAWSRVFFEIGDGTEKFRTSSEGWSVPAGFWSHVAATYDGKTTRLYRNAQLIKEEEVTGPIAPLDRPMVIGAYLGRKDAYNFKGLLDQLKIFDRAISPEGIFALTDFAK